MERIERIILKNLIYTEDYTRKVLPFLREDYFSDVKERLIFNKVSQFVQTYKALPSYEALVIELKNTKKVAEKEVSDAVSILDELRANKQEKTNEKWLIEASEKFCQDRAIYNAIMESVSILDNKQGPIGKGEIPKLLSDALGVSFDTNIGHDYMDDSDSRYDFYHRVEERIPFDIDLLNKITKNGLPKKTLNICLAGTGVGKSLFMCHVAASCLSQGKNVLYITLEMAEERIAERIDANLMNVPLKDLSDMTKLEYEKRFKALRARTNGKLIIKEYPTATAGSMHFRSLLNELHLKKNFRPDLICVDYLNICCSSRIKPGANINSYQYVKAIAEELRGLAVEFDLPILSATQTTRSGYTSSDPGLEDTSESFGLPATADFMFALISTEELDQLNQIMFKQLKNRYNDPSYYKRFVIGIDRSKMKLFNVEESAQKDIADSGQDPSDDKEDKPLNTFGNRESKFTKNKFGSFKM